MQKLILQNSFSQLNLNLNLGGQIENLVLKHPTTEELISVILPFNIGENFFHSGNFLMYPWVNRLEANRLQILNQSISIEPLEKDAKGSPIHGLYFNTSRKLVELKKNFAKIEPIAINESFPTFTESFFLEENSLRIRTDFYNPTSDIQEFAYGYHPYLKLNTNIENCSIHTNLTEYIPLTDELLPNPNLERKNITYLFSTDTPIGKLKLDHLFVANAKESFFGITDPVQNLLLQIRVSPNSQIPLPYFQVYTPDNRASIAIEPMTSTGNAFFIKNSGLCRLNPGAHTFGEFLIELKTLPL